MKKILIMILSLMLAASLFADGRKFDSVGNLNGVEENEMNGALYSATLHFISKGSLYVSGKIENNFFISDGEESYLIPISEFTEVYWKYPIDSSKLSEIVDEDIVYTAFLINELKSGFTYKPHTTYSEYQNYIDALERGEDASYEGVTVAAVTKL